jgi:rubredoxin
MLDYVYSPGSGPATENIPGHRSYPNTPGNCGYTLQ